MGKLIDIVRLHKAGLPTGVYSVCSAHPLVIEAALRHVLDNDEPVAVVEATSNQVNQDGGYTGMTPTDFRDLVMGIARKLGLDERRVILGGDHLGPNAWQHLDAAPALLKAERMIDAYVRAGFTKIHLDCSMSCADDPVPLSDEVVASRAARLCAVAEDAHAATGGEPPVYIVGTEVPVPGGAHEDLTELQVTDPAAAVATIEVHRTTFEKAGLAAAWLRVVAIVVQPGVEFDHERVVEYLPVKATGLSRAIARIPNMVFEAHSTDYQSSAALAHLVQDHFAILKVGPGVTFALREALWSLDAIEAELVQEEQRASLRKTAVEVMLQEPQHWQKYHEGSGNRLKLDLQFSLSDRIRYYWPHPEVAAAQQRLFGNLSQASISLPLISQYFPHLYQDVRLRRLDPTPHELTIAHIRSALEPYSAACGFVAQEIVQ